MKEHKRLPTSKEHPIKSNLKRELTTSETDSFGTHGAKISSIPNGNGKAVSVNLEKAVKIINQVRQSVTASGEEKF